MSQRRILGEELDALAADIVPALEDVAFPAYLIDRGGRIRWLNDAAAKLVGDVRGRLAASVVAPAQRAMVRETVARKLLGERRTDFATTLTTRDGRDVPVEVSSVGLRDERGAVVGIFGLFYALPDRSPRAHPDYGLSPREHEVLLNLAAGCSTAEMARRMGISVETVRNHVRRLLRKLGVHSRVEAVALARREGLVG
jgi:PAS domain S-box-containing protein